MTLSLFIAARQFEDNRVHGSQCTEEISARDQEISVCYQQHARYERELQDSAARYDPYHIHHLITRMNYPYNQSCLCDIYFFFPL